MAEGASQIQALREALQPSLWDRLVDDLSGLVAEIDQRRAELEREIGEERLSRILAGGRRALSQEVSLDQDEQRSIHLFLTQIERRSMLEQRTIVVTANVLREAVRRDIEALFNTERMQSRMVLSDFERGTVEDQEDVLASFPLVRRSVLNYGVPSFAGRRATDFDIDDLTRQLRDVVAVFEPRFKSESIRILVYPGEKSGFRVGIEGVLMLSPVPERLRLSTTIDLDNGRASTVIEDF